MIKHPFLHVDLLGFFEYKGEYSEHLEIEAASLLYPYLRNQISTITLNSNEFPPYLLPIIDLDKEFSDGKNISRVDSEVKNKNSFVYLVTLLSGYS
ncbi:protein-export chaperone SecB [Staphylococcus xylosus]|uniref:Protein-export chaperone SecB n=1 Tax=Staphylococcus xylosus TaxID=1288 RepID=A0A939NHI8_STAXY|nr:protein-export chaperone SecB [Staphylococcus xylosus]